MSTTAAATRPPVTFPLRLGYGFGSVAFGAKTYLMGQLLFFYSQLVGLPPIWVSVALAVSLTFDAFWDPFIGQISDGVNSRWGRRHPFMYAAALPSALTLILLFNPPLNWSQPAQLAYMFALVVAARCTISLYEVPATALTPELAPMYDERTRLLSYRYFFATIATAGAAFIGLMVFLRPVTLPTGETLPGQMNLPGYSPFAITVAVLMVVSIITASLVTHKFIPFLHKPASKRPTIGETMREMLATLSNRNFLVVTLAALISGIGGGLTNGLNTYFNTFMWGLQARDLATIFLGPIIASFVALLLAPIVSRRLGKKRGCITLFVIGVVVSILPLALRLVGVIPYSMNGTPALVAILFADRVITSILGVSGFIIVASMLADVVEESQLSTGRRSEGLLLSADNVLQKVVGAMAGILPGIMIAAVHLPTGRGVNPASVPHETMHNLAMMYLPASTAFSLLAIATLSFYRIDRTQHEANLEKLREAAAAAEALAEERASA